jgi:anti-sigma factor (TIGR02949 family)
MNCAEARFLLYAYLDRETPPAEEAALERHLTACEACATRGRSARGLANLLHSRLGRAQAPERLRMRIYYGAHPTAPSRGALVGLTAAILLLIVPLVADGVPERRPVVTAAVADVISKHLTGTLVCLDCENRKEVGLCEAHAGDGVQDAAFCADDGEVWRLVPTNTGFSRAAMGQTLTVDGVAFPQSGFLRASRAGY